jgi:heat shock protein HslJ
MRPLPTLLLLAALFVTTLGVPGSARAQVQDVPGPAVGLAIPPVVWQLTAFPGVGPIAEPGRYTVQFLPDGSVSIRADCNWVGGFWSGGEGALDITTTTSTLAGCPPDSLEQTFVQALDAATSYAVDGVSLVIAGPAGEMHFSPALPAMA